MKYAIWCLVGVLIVLSVLIVAFPWWFNHWGTSAVWRFPAGSVTMTGAVLQPRSPELRIHTLTIACHLNQDYALRIELTDTVIATAWKYLFVSRCLALKRVTIGMCRVELIGSYPTAKDPAIMYCNRFHVPHWLRWFAVRDLVITNGLFRHVEIFREYDNYALEMKYYFTLKAADIVGGASRMVPPGKIALAADLVGEPRGHGYLEMNIESLVPYSTFNVAIELRSIYLPYYWYYRRGADYMVTNGMFDYDGIGRCEHDVFTARNVVTLYGLELEPRTKRAAASPPVEVLQDLVFDVPNDVFVSFMNSIVQKRFPIEFTFHGLITDKSFNLVQVFKRAFKTSFREIIRKETRKTDQVVKGVAKSVVDVAGKTSSELLTQGLTIDQQMFSLVDRTRLMLMRGLQVLSPQERKNTGGAAEEALSQNERAR